MAWEGFPGFILFEASWFKRELREVVEVSFLQSRYILQDRYLNRDLLSPPFRVLPLYNGPPIRWRG